MSADQEALIATFPERLEKLTQAAGDIPESILAWQEFIIFLDQLDIQQAKRPLSALADCIKIKQLFDGDLTSAHTFIELQLHAEHLYKMLVKGEPLSSRSFLLSGLIGESFRELPMLLHT